MEIHREYESLDLKNPFVTVGVFDGVHLGHRALIGRLVSKSKQAGGESVVITFDPHPRIVLSEKDEEVYFLSTTDEKVRLLSESGIDHLVIVKFTRELASMEAEDFIRKVLVENLKVKHLVVGYDNHFGRGRGGNIEKIRGISGLYGFEVDHFDRVYCGHSIVSSSLIRDLISKGGIEEANRFLGHSYTLTGKVVEGRKIGRSLGFPTANIKPDNMHKLIPANGVYVVETALGNDILPGILSIGFNPTVSKTRSVRSIEVHLFDFDRDLYDEVITVIFRFRLRDEKKFKNTGLLVEQMKLDKESALRLLK